jgi:predicted PurR-regulated permease PerM
VSESEDDAPAPRVRQDTGPAEINDPQIALEARKAAIWIGIAALFALVAFLAHPLLVIFGGMVFAALIDGGARLLGRVLPIARGWRVAIVIAAGALFLAWTAMLAGSQITEQASELPGIVESQWATMLDWLSARGFELGTSDLKSLVQQGLSGIGPLTTAVGGIIGVVTTLFLIVVLGIYFAAEPRLYRRGVSWMLPVGSREFFRETAEEMGRSLRRLLAGRLLGMIVEGTGTWLLLELYGVPMAALLGLLTGLLAFLPNIGAPISGALTILVGFSGGMEMGIYTVIVYFTVQIVDGYLIVPMIARKTVDLAPALVLGAQLIMGVLFGILGLALADPLVAMIKVWLEQQASRREQNADKGAAATGSS